MFHYVETSPAISKLAEFFYRLSAFKAMQWQFFNEPRLLCHKNIGFGIKNLSYPAT